MAKGRKHGTSPGRTRRRSKETHRPGSAPSSGGADRDDLDPQHQQLIVTIGEVLHDGSPLEMLEIVSRMLAATDPRGRHPFERGDAGSEQPTYEILLESMMGVRLNETSAVLAVLAATTDDELQAARIRRELAERHHRLPGWLRNLAFEPYHTEQMREAYGDGDDIVVGVRLPSGYEFTIVTYLEHNLGGIVKDAFVLPAPSGSVVQTMKASLTGGDQWFEDLAAADARARLEDAIERDAMTFPPSQTDSWPGCRQLVEWALRELPAGGHGYERPEWSEQDVAHLIEEFFDSEHGGDLDHADGRSMVESLLWFGTDYGPGDPLHWSPISVEIVMTDWLPRKIVADADYLATAPKVLRAFIRFAHDRTGLRAGLTQEAVAAVDRWEPDYQRAIRAPRRQGPEALLERMGALAPLGPEGAWSDDLSVDEIMLESVVRAVGEDALDVLAAHPLPDEPYDRARLPEDVRERADEVVRLLDEFCDEHADVEFRTATRRLLADAASGDPNIFRRKGAAKTAAAAVTWMVAKANDLIGSWGSMTAQELVAAFGVTGSVAQRSHVFQKAIGVDPHGQYGAMDLGTPRYLISARRRELIEQRDRYRTS